MAGEDLALAPWWSDRERGLSGLSVYRNTVAKGLADALIAQFPAVTAVVGVDWMNAAAAIYAPQHPPTRAPLNDYGQDFPAWLAEFAPARDMPYLADLARLDCAWTQTHLAADADPLPADALAGLPPQAYAEFTLRPHPATRWANFDLSVPALWRHLRGAVPIETLDLEDAPQGLLMVRPGGEVTSHIIDPGLCAFLDACQATGSVAEAAQQAVMAQPELDLAPGFALLLQVGCFSRLDPISE